MQMFGNEVATFPFVLTGYRRFNLIRLHYY